MPPNSYFDCCDYCGGVDSDSLDTAVDDELSLPVGAESALVKGQGRGWKISTSANVCHFFLLGAERFRHCSPSIFDISGFGRPGYRATTVAW